MDEFNVLVRILVPKKCGQYDCAFTHCTLRSGKGNFVKRLGIFVTLPSVILSVDSNTYCKPCLV